MNAPSLQSLRQQGAWRIDPLRFRYIENLAARIEQQPEPVRAILQQRLDQVLQEYTAAAPAARGAAGDAARRRAPSPLALLNTHIRTVSPSACAGDELASALRFRRVHAEQHTREQVARAAARAPVNAGPLNSHLLVLQALQALEGLSGGYLRRFVQQVEALQWLDAQPDAVNPASAPQAAARRKPARAPSRPRR